MLHITSRPENLEEVAGQKDAVAVLRAFLARKKEDQPRVYLFSGPSGCGKTTLARILAREMGVATEDLMEVNAANFNGIDTVRDIEKKMSLSPRVGTRRAWILDEAHRLTKDAQGALLKALEDTPLTVAFYIATTDPQKLLPTLKNRCAHIEVHSLTETAIYRLLVRVADKEGKPISEKVGRTIAGAVNGSARLAMTTLDMLIDLPADEQEKMALRVESKDAAVIDLCRALFYTPDWAKIAPMVDALKPVADAEEVRRCVLGYCATVMVKNGKEARRAYVVMLSFQAPTYDIGWPGVVLSCYQATA